MNLNDFLSNQASFPKKRYSLDSVIDFGKHRGSTIRSLIENEVSYVQWLVTEGRDFTLDDRAYSVFERTLSEWVRRKEEMRGERHHFPWEDCINEY